MLGVHPFWYLFGGWMRMGLLEIDFAAENGKIVFYEKRVDRVARWNGVELNVVSAVL